MNIKKYKDTSYNKITSIVLDGYSIWVSYLGSDNTSKLQKTSGFNPSVVDFDLDIEATKIVRMIKISTDIFCIFEDSINFIGQFSNWNPFNDSDYETIPDGETESPVDITTDGTYLYVLTPGVESGEVAKVYKYNTSLVLQSTMTLDESAGTINNATSIAWDGSNHLYITTNEDPAKLLKLNITTETYEMWYITDQSGYN